MECRPNRRDYNSYDRDVSFFDECQGVPLARELMIDAETLRV